MRFRKYRSWVTITMAPRYFNSCSSSNRTVSLSIWLVGSSSSKTSLGWIRATAIPARRFSPPDNVLISLVSSVMPSFPRIDFASNVFASLRSAGRCSMTCSNTLPCGSNSGICGRYEMRIPLVRMTLPLSGSSAPARIRKSVDFPVPLMPIIPTLSPSFKKKETSSSTFRSIYVLAIFCADNNIIVA